MSKILAWFEIVPTRDETRRLIWKILVFEMTLAGLYLTGLMVTGELTLIIQEINAALRTMADSPDVRGSPTLEEEQSVLGFLKPLFIGALTVGVLAPLLEEAVFRLLPIGVAILAFRWSQWTKPLILASAVVSGVLFGLAHLSHAGPTLTTVLMLQGIGGILYGILFAKVSGLKLKGLWRAFKTTVIVHSLWNLVCIPLLAAILLLIFGPIVVIHLEIPPELLK